MNRPAKEAQMTITLKDTKSTIFKAYEEALGTIKELKSKQFNPTKVKAQESDKKAIAKVEKMDWDLPTAFANLRNVIEGNLRSIEGALEQEKREIESVAQARVAMVTELNDLYGISAEAESLAALVEAKKRLSDKVDEELAKKREDTDAHIQEELERVRDEAVAWDEEKARRREVWEYDFERECKRREDNFNDTLGDKGKEWRLKLDAMEKALNEREEALAKQEDEFVKLRALVDSFPQELEDAKEEARSKAKQACNFEVVNIKKSYDADMKVMENQVDTLQAAKNSLEEKVSALESKLENAYEKIQGVASKALEAQGSALTTAEVQKAVAAATSGKSR